MVFLWEFPHANHGFVEPLAWSYRRVTKWKPRKSNVAPARSIAQVKPAIPMLFRTQKFIQSVASGSRTGFPARARNNTDFTLIVLRVSQDARYWRCDGAQAWALTPVGCLLSLLQSVFRGDTHKYCYEEARYTWSQRLLTLTTQERPSLLAWSRFAFWHCDTRSPRARVQRHPLLLRLLAKLDHMRLSGGQ